MTVHQELQDLTVFQEKQAQKVRRETREMKEQWDHQDLQDLPETTPEQQSLYTGHQDQVETQERKAHKDPRDTSVRLVNQDNPEHEVPEDQLVTRDHKVQPVKMELMDQKENQEASDQSELPVYLDDQDLKDNVVRKVPKEMLAMLVPRVLREMLAEMEKMESPVFQV